MSIKPLIYRKNLRKKIGICLILGRIRIHCSRKRIHIKMKRIRNTDKYFSKYSYLFILYLYKCLFKETEENVFKKQKGHGRKSMDKY